MTTHFENLFREGDHASLLDLSDAKLRTEDGHSYDIHKYVLAKNCQYFFALFCGMGKGKDDVLIPGIKGEILSNVLSYIYTGTVHSNERNIFDLIVAADYLLLDNLLEHIKTRLAENLSVHNAIAILIAAEKINRYDYLQESYRFIGTHFEEVVFDEDAGIPELPLEALKQLLNDRNLRVRNERIVWLAIVKWVDDDLTNRQSQVKDLLMCLKVADIDEALATEILEHTIVKMNLYCQELCNMQSSNPTLGVLKNFQDYFLNTSNSLSIFHAHRRPLTLQFIAHYCTFDSIEGIKIYITYDENIDLWRKVLEAHLSPECLLTVGNCIYMFGTAENVNYCYNVIEMRWVEISNFRIPRIHYVVVKLQELIFILGGISIFTENEIYDAEIYDSRTDTWHDTTPMLPVTSFASVPLNGSVYVVGNTGNIIGLEMIAQVYDPQAETWNRLPQLSVARYNFALVVYHQKIYVIGGTNGDTHLKDVEVYDPANNFWYSIASLPHVYYSPKAIVINDTLIVYDNHLEDRSYLKTNPPLRWNTDLKCWNVVEQSSELNSLHMYYFFTVEDSETVNAISYQSKDPATVFEKSPFT